LAMAAPALLGLGDEAASRALRQVGDRALLRRRPLRLLHVPTGGGALLHRGHGITSGLRLPESSRIMLRMTADRLILRQWRDEDSEPFAAMCADPEVMRYFPKLLVREESDALIASQRALIELRGWGLWA